MIEEAMALNEASTAAMAVVCVESVGSRTCTNIDFMRKLNTSCLNTTNHKILNILHSALLLVPSKTPRKKIIKEYKSTMCNIFPSPHTLNYTVNNLFSCKWKKNHLI